jgi:starvation-inducible outer membrane lipoprotein
MIQQEINVVKNFLNNDLVQLLVAEANRLPHPYGGTIAAVVGSVGPMLIEFLNKKIDEIGQPTVTVAPVAPAAVAAPQG